MNKNIMKSVGSIALALSVLVVVSCEKTGVEHQSNDSITLSEESYETGPEVSTASVVITSSDDWRAVTVNDWIHLSADSGKSGDAVSVSVDANYTGAERRGTVKFFTGSALKKFEVVCGAGYKLDVVSRTSVELEPHSQLFEVLLETNVDTEDLEYSFADAEGQPAEWVKFEKSGTRVGGISYATFQVEANPSASERSGVLTVSGKGIERKLDVLQNLRRYINVSVEGDPLFDIVESFLVVNVDASIPYEFEMSDWISLQSDEGNGRYLFRIAESTKTRSGFITVYNPDMPPYTQTVAVKQVNSALPEVDVPDEVFRKWLLDKEWITQSDGRYILTDAGAELTSMSYTGGGINSFRGVEKFAALESLSISSATGWSASKYVLADEYDLSELTNLKSLAFDYVPVKKIVLGDNPVESINIKYLAGFYNYDKPSPESFTVSGSKIKRIEIPLRSDYGVGTMDVYNRLETVDVSGCPALEYLNIRRAFYSRSKFSLKKVIVSSDQKRRIDSGLLKIDVLSSVNLSDVLVVAD